MKIKIYIVTYNNDIILKNNLDRLLSSDLINYDFSIHVINNFSKLNGFDTYNIEILDNVLRPDFSCGHLSRSWNQSIINGFKNLNNPDCDILITLQNDTFVKNNTFSKIINLHNRYNFIQVGAGDQLMSFTPNGVKQMGIFDERFCSIGFQEADYFMNALMTNKNDCSITDRTHNRFNNPINDDLIENKHSLNHESYIYKIDSIPITYLYHEYNLKLFFEKWNKHPENWPTHNTISSNIEPLIKRYMLYPYFEKDIETLDKQKYFL